MKESELIRMKREIKLTQQALVVALAKIERIESKLEIDATTETKEVRDE